MDGHPAGALTGGGGEPEAFALAKPGAGSEDYERPIAVRDSLDDRLNDLGLQRLDPSRFGPR
jgi:hypothetical protein